MFTANITIHAEGAESQSFECLIGLDTKGCLIIRGKTPLTQSEFYRNNYRKLKDTGNKLMYSVDKSNAKRVDALIADMSGCIQEIQDELYKIPRFSAKDNNATALINEARANDHTTHWSYIVDGKIYKNMQIHWMENPAERNAFRSENGSIKYAPFKYKGTDNYKNVYVSNNLVEWYPLVNDDEESKDIEETIADIKAAAKVENAKITLNTNLHPDVKEFLKNVITEIDKNLNKLHQEIRQDAVTATTKKSDKETKKDLKSKLNDLEAKLNDPFETMDTNVTQVEPKFSVALKEVLSVFLNWMIRQDPINLDKHRPVHYKIICDLIEVLSEQLLAISKCMFDDFYYFDVTEKELKNLIHNLIFDNVATKDYFTALNISYNEAKNGVTIADRYADTKTSVTFCSRYDGPDWIDDFIDLDALCNNVTRDIIKYSTPKAE